MPYQVLSLKWRPQTFADLVGQKHVSQTLINAFKKDRVAQAYALTGPRGVGKTTTARIIAKALNCKSLQNFDPCNGCSNCKEITDGRNIDVIEIDGASNRGIEEIRTLREQIKYPPMSSSYKVYIIDEVHMLTTQAFNALLRTLEEPPSHGKFILATTDAHKIPSTIISRCQRFDFRRISNNDIKDRLSMILDDEKIVSDLETLNAISMKADGSMRDALSLLDQVIAYAGENISIDSVSIILGVIPIELYFSYSDAILYKDNKSMIDILAKLKKSGYPLDDIIFGLNNHFRDLLISSAISKDSNSNININNVDKYLQSAKKWDSNFLLKISIIINEMEMTLKKISQPSIFFEMNSLKFIEMNTSGAIKKSESPILNSPNNADNDNQDTKNLINKTNNFKKPETLKIEKNSVEKKNEAQTAPAEVQKNSNNVEPTNTTIEHSSLNPAKPAEIASDVKNDNIKAADKTVIQATLHDIIDKWPMLIEKISKERPSISTVLEYCKPVNLNNNIINMKMRGLPKFQAENLKNNSRLIEDCLKLIFNEKLNIKIDWEESDSQSKPAFAQRNESTNENAIKHQEDLQSKVIEIFDGEILR